jgi:pimeloyl-ACP methyl ester carboxylesterase
MNNSASSAMSRQWRKRCGGPSRNHRYDIVEVCQCLAWPDVPGARQTICCRRLNPSIRQMLIPQTSYFFRLRSWDDASALGCACLTISVSVRRQARPVHSKLGTRMRCANFIGRVGPLAFALGVGSRSPLRPQRHLPILLIQGRRHPPTPRRRPHRHRRRNPRLARRRTRVLTARHRQTRPAELDDSLRCVHAHIAIRR